MHWEYGIKLYTEVHCNGRGLQPSTIAAYRAVLEQFRKYIRYRVDDKLPCEITSRDILDYVVHLRKERENQQAAINRTIVIISNFYKSLVAMKQLDPHENPTAGFPRMKTTPRKLPKVLNNKEMDSLVNQPSDKTVIGLRDRAVIMLLYCTGIRASECSGLRESDVDLVERTIIVTGKGGHQRKIRINESACRAMIAYRNARGLSSPHRHFFISMRGKGLSRNAIYERIRTTAIKAGINKPVSPHWLRHTCATDLVRAGVNIVVVQELLGHRHITSTQVYFHVSGESLAHAAEQHPINRFRDLIDELLPGVMLPFKHPPRRAGFG